MPKLRRHRLLICGDRNWTDDNLVREVFVQYLSQVDCVIEGEARGADTIGRQVAEEFGILVLPFPADWATHGRAAGPIRNRQMLKVGCPTLVLAFHDDLDSSKGTKDMVNAARRVGIPVRIIQHAG